MTSSISDKGFLPYHNARRLLAAGLALGLALPLIYAFQAGSIVQFLAVGSVGLAIVGASFAVGGLIGFVFGVPRQLQDARPVPRNDDPGTNSADDRHAPYAGNTSLEQISDWLTKILVGVGLTQLANVPAGLAALGNFLAPAFGGLPTSSVFATGLVLYALLDGFFLSYLWTLLYLPSLFAESDVRALISSAEQRGVQQGEQKVIRASTTAAVARAALAEGEPKALHALWVDDRPANNTGEMQWIQGQVGIEFTTKTSTAEAIEELEANPDRYALVISDMSRPGDRRAGYTLLQEMTKRGIQTPLVIYSASGRAEYDEEARALGALGSTNSPTRLLELISQVVQSQAKDGA